MSDEEVQSLLRAAEAQGDAATWLRAAQALARAGRIDEAARAGHVAATKGSDADALLDGLLPPTLERHQRELGTRFELGKLGNAAWSPDGRRVYAVAERQTVVAWDLEERGSPARRLAVLPGVATALGATTTDELAVGYVTVDARGKEQPVLARLSTKTGELSKPIGRGHKFIRDVAAHEGIVLAAETKRARAYRRDEAGWPDKTCWSVNGEVVALSPTGTAAAFVLESGKLVLALHDALVKEPRLTIGLDLPRVDPRLHLEAAGRRVALVFEDVVVLEPDGKPLGRAPLPAGLQVHEALPSPSGRVVAILFAQGGERTTRLDLVDVAGGTSKSFELGARPRRPAWSLSGRRLAVPTDQGTVVVIDSAAGPREVPAVERAKDKALADALWGSENAADGEWIELRSDDRFWRGRRLGALLEFRHGKLGTKGQVGASPCETPEAAARELERRIREKERDGYARF